MNNEIKIIITSTLCFIAIMTSMMFSWEATRRSSDEWAKIYTSKIEKTIPDEEKIKSCIDGGGIPNYDSGHFMDCRINQN